MKLFCVSNMTILENDRTILELIEYFYEKYCQQDLSILICLI